MPKRRPREQDPDAGKPTGVTVTNRDGAARLDYATTDHQGDPRFITAAAQILSSRRIQRAGTSKQKKSASHPWQHDAWLMFDEIGELWFAINWMASALSRVRLFAARVTEDSDEPAPVTDGLAAELVAGFAGGAGGQAQFMQRAGSHLALVGDTYIVGRTVRPGDDQDDAAPAGPPERGIAPIGGPDEDEQEGGDAEADQVWQAYSTEETSYDADTWKIDDGDEKFDIGPDDLIIRCWRPHPRKYSEAQSPVRPSLPVLRELRGLTMHVSAQVDSRLAGAGILFIPMSATFASPSAAQSGDAADGEDPFVRDLLAAMITPIKDRDSAAAVVPLVVKVPDEAIGQVQHISFAGPLDEKAKDLRDEALRRFALGFDMPPEVVLGMSDSNHWSAWQIDQATVRIAVAPLAATICLALTVGWLQPALEAAGEADPDQFMVWFDVGALEQRSDRSADAKELYDRFAIGPDSLRRECGFGEDDAPTSVEMARMVALKLLDKVTDVTPLLEALGINGVDVETEPGDGGGDDEVSEPDRSLPSPPEGPPGDDGADGGGGAP